MFSFVEGFVGALQFDDSTTDFIWCERVLQHLADPQSANNDIARVPRPGGRAVLLDSDYGTRIVSDLDPDLAAALSRASLGPIANPYAARHIPAQIHAAGLELEPDVGRRPSCSPRRCCRASSAESETPTMPSNLAGSRAKLLTQPYARSMTLPSAA